MGHLVKIVGASMALLTPCDAQDPGRVTRSFSIYQATQPSMVASPDGKTLYFQLLGDLVAVPVKGGPAKILTKGRAYDSWPLPSADGETLYFLSDRIGDEDRVHRLNLATDAIALVSEPALLDSLPPLHGLNALADGSRVLVSREGDSTGRVRRVAVDGSTVLYEPPAGRRIEWASVDSTARYVVSCESGPWEERKPNAREILVVELATKKILYRCANGPYTGVSSLETRAAFAAGKAYIPRGATILEVDLATGKAKAFDWLARVTHSFPIRGNRRVRESENSRGSGDGHAGLPAKSLILEGFTVVDVETGELRENQRLHLEDGRIVSVEVALEDLGSDVRVIRGRGRFLMSGLFDMHVDESEASSPRMLAYGVTTVRQFAARRHSEQRPIDLDPKTGPRMIFAEDASYAPASTPARQRVAAVIERAHGQGLPVTAHAASLRAIVTGVSDGLDCIEHYPDNVPDIGDDLLALLKNGTVAFCPTLSVRGFGDFKMRFAEGGFAGPQIDDSSDANLRSLVLLRCHTLKRARRSGVRILTGSGSSSSSGIGPSVHWELEALVMGGLSTREALYAATKAPADYAGLRDRGSLRPGQLADMVVLRQNPLADIANTRSIDAVVLDGRWFEVGELLGGK